MKYLRLTLGIFAASAAFTSAQVVVYDGFVTGTDVANGEYAPGADVTGTTNGGTGWSSTTWSSGVSTFTGVATGLTYSDGTNTLVTTPGAIRHDSTGGALARSLPDPANGNDFWFSAIMDGSELLTNFESRFQIGFYSSTGDIKYAIESQDDSRGWYATYNPVGAGAVTSQIDAGTLDIDDGPTFFIAQVTNFNSGSVDSVMSVWYNPADLTNIGSADLVSSAFESQGFDEIRFVADGNRPGAIDEIRVGESLSDVVVVPEPSTYALFSGLAMLGLVLIRRRLRAV